MMKKKLLILMLVFGLASVANAAYIPLTLTMASPATADQGVQFTVTVTMSGLPGGEFNSAIRDFAIDVTAAGGATYTAGTIDYLNTFDGPSSPADLGAWTNGGEIDIESNPPDPYAGNVMVFSFTATGTANSGTLTFDLIDATGKMMVAVTDLGNYSLKTMGPLTVNTATTTLIPEPMTIALLGLGSLFLLRRRK